MRKQTEKGWIVNFICSILLLGIFAVGALLLLNVGVRVYKNIALNNAENYKLRTSLSYVATKLRQTDAQGCVSLEERQELPVLVLREMDGDLEMETLIYFYQGSLREVYQMAGANFRPDSGGVIVEAAEFSMTLGENGMVHMTAKNKNADQQSLQVFLQSYLPQ